MSPLVKDTMVKDVVTAPGDMLISNAAYRMRQENVGCLVATDGLGPIGIVTDRDLVTGCLAEAHDGTNCKVIAHTSKQLITVNPEEDISDATNIMRRMRIKRLPVVHRGLLVGLISCADIAVAMQSTIKDVLDLEGMDAVQPAPAKNEKRSLAHQNVSE